MSDQIEHSSNGKRIAKNTVFLYIRMLLIMGVTLFTSRIVLDKLGESDYGIYNSVAGVVAMLGFLNGTLSTGTSRFLTFAIGKNNTEELKETFSTAFFSHLLLAIIVSIILLSVGVWFVEHKLIIPDERLYAAKWVLIIAVIQTFITITQVPYTSVIIARENMSVYAYVGIFEAIANLGVAYSISISPWDTLILYAALLAAVKILVALYYRFYCSKHYKETHLQKHFNKTIFKEMMGFSGWSLLANISEVLGRQGLTVIMNMFFSPVVVSAQAIGNQISGAISTFIGNFRTAINPQIIKLYANNDYAESRKLTLNTYVYVFELLLILCLPIIVLMEQILNLWLVEVPEYAVVFGRYIVATHLLGGYSSALYVPMVASGHLKENSYASVVVSFGGIILLYFLLKTGCSVMWVQYIGLIQVFLYSFVVKPFILCKYIPDYKWKYIYNNIIQCVKIAVAPVIVSILLYKHYQATSLIQMMLVVVIIVSVIVVSALIFMDKQMKHKLLELIKSKLSHKS
ncbi:MAG: oligosaccharide flippase family protein [Bacteroidales bacterium]|nr:oligosaccharide flippase family protein [Bacteroidales bacterium]